METGPVFNNDDAYKNVVSVSPFWKRFKAIEDIDGITADTWIKKAALLNEISAQNNVAVFLYNTFTQRFIFMSDKMKVLGGYDPELHTSESGIPFTFSNFRPDQVNAVLKVQEVAFNYFIKHKVSVSDKVLINMDFLYKHKDGHYFQFLQQMMVVQIGSNGAPLLVLSFGYNISHIKKENSVSLIITAPWGDEFYTYNTDFDSFEPVKPFSEQEKKILQLLGQGLDSKAIADKLFISPHTVDTHRRNLISKTSCVNTTSVVAYSQMINLA